MDKFHSDFVVETEDHLDWLAVSKHIMKDDNHVATTGLIVRGMPELYALKQAIDEYIWRYERES